MRLIEYEKNVIVNAIKNFDKQARIYLFGSRVDDTKKGGDIDILIITDVLNKNDLLYIEEDVFSKIDEQKIDFVLAKNDTNDSFVKMILQKGAVDLCLQKSLDI